MSLENVKVGDRVWLGGYKRKRVNGETVYEPNPWYNRVVEKVSPKQFTVTGGSRFWIASGKSSSGDVATALAIATPEQLAEWDAQVAQAKAEKEAAESKRQQEQEERRLRLFRCAEQCLKVGFAPFHDRNEFEFEGHKYIIKEAE